MPFVGYPNDSKIEEAIATDNLESYIKLINQKPDILQLTLAVEHHSIKICDYILVQDSDLVNQHNEQGATPLTVAVGKKDIELITKLLESGADANLAQTQGLKATSLMLASANNDIKAMDLLITHGAAVNQVDVNNDHAINWATYYGHLQAMQLLLDRGADIELKSKHGNAIDVCYRLWHADSVANVFRQNIKKSDLSKTQKQLFESVRSGDFSAFERLMKKESNPNLKDELGTPLLHHAAERGDVESVKLLINQGVDVNEFNRAGQTALAYACRFGRKEVVNILLTANANVNVAGEHYRLTPIIGAAIHGDIDVAQLLIDNGVALNTKDSVNQAAALHWAMFYGNTELATFLINSGVDYKSDILAGRYTGESLAKAYRYNDIIEAIEAKERSQNPLFGSWIMNEIGYQQPDTTAFYTMEYPGRLIISDNRYSIMYNPYAQNRKPSKDVSKLTDEEMIYCFKTLAFNSGTYTIKDSVLTTTADMAKVSGFEGGIQYYSFAKLPEGQIKMTMYDETYPDGKKPEWYGKLKIVFILEKE